MNRGCLRILATASAVAIVLTGAALERRNVVIDDIDRLTANSGSLAQRVAVGERTHGELTSTLADHQARAALDTTLVEARAPFVAAVGTFSTALQSAKGKVDASAAAARVTAAQDTVLAERDRPDVVAAATQTVTAAGGEVTAAVKAYDDEQQRIAEAAAAAAARNRASSGGGGGGWSGPRGGGGGGGGGGSSAGGGGDGGGGSAVDRARAALNQVGGGHIAVRAYDGNCQGRYADACSFSSGYIAVAPAVAGFSQSRLVWAMAHELAHQAQFGVWGALQRSGSYSALFGNNAEALANCMAAVRGYGSCSGAQADFARGVWNRNVPG